MKLHIEIIGWKGQQEAKSKLGLQEALKQSSLKALLKPRFQSNVALEVMPLIVFPSQMISELLEHQNKIHHKIFKLNVYGFS